MWMQKQRRNGWKPKYPVIKMVNKGQLKEDLWLGGDLICPNEKFLFGTIYTDAGGEFGKQFHDWVISS